jgi:curved DNA-binding protein CbpA
MAMANREHRDPYVVLGLRRQASPDEIARAYRRAARATHPDGGGAGAGAEPFQAVSDAYDLLRDPGRRAGYDRLHPLPRQQAAGVAAGSVRYAASGSQHVVLGSGPPPAALRPRPSGYEDDVASLRRLGDLQETVLLALSLLRGW